MSLERSQRDLSKFGEIKLSEDLNLAKIQNLVLGLRIQNGGDHKFKKFVDLGKFFNEFHNVRFNTKITKTFSKSQFGLGLRI